MTRNFIVFAALLLLTLGGCGGDAGLSGDLPNSAPIVDIRNSGCVGGSACNTQYEWLTAKCEELPVSGLPLGRCWMTKRYVLTSSNSQQFEASATGDGALHLYWARSYGYGSQFNVGTPSSNFANLFGVIRREGRNLRTTALKLVRDDGAAGFLVSFTLPGQTCVAHYRDRSRAGENPNLQLRVVTTLCRPEGQPVAPDEVMALVQATRFR